MSEIKLFKNNSGRSLSDVEWIEEFYEFLQGGVLEGLVFGHGHKPKLSAKKAFAIIYYLQEYLPVFPDHIEKCWRCGCLFDSDSEGLYWQAKGRPYCGGCWHVVPRNYDNNNR